MSRFGTRKKVTTNTVVNYAGGESYKQSAELELASILLTSFTSDKYYRSSSDEIKRLKELLPKVDPEIICKAAVYARQVAGMRSISHVLTAEIAKYISGKDYARIFYNAVVRRPDDMIEILSYGKSAKWGYKSLPKAMERGFKDAFNKFDEYQIAKWRKPGNEISLLNILHLTHPVPNSTLNKLYSNKLRSKNTRESVLAGTGQIENKNLLSAVEIAQAKEENLKAGWKELLSNKKIGYKALIGSVVKITKEAPEMIDIACEMIGDYNLIRKSLVMPSEIIVAIEQINKINSYDSRKVLLALDKALDYSVENAPKFNGKTIVVLDESGSMGGKPALIGGLFAAVLCKANACDLMTFATTAKYRKYNPNDSVSTIASSIKFSGGGTNFRAIFNTLRENYDRIIILSDMQGWVGYNSPKAEFDSYCKRFGVNPYVYSWDLNGYGTTQLPAGRIFALAGFNNNVFDIMKNMEESEKGLLDKIKSVNFYDYVKTKTNKYF